MPNGEVRDYVEEFRRQGVRDEAIRKTLLVTGFSEAEIDAELEKPRAKPEPRSAALSIKSSALVNFRSGLPLSGYELLSESFFIYRKNFLALFLLALVPAVLLWAGSARGSEVVGLTVSAGRIIYFFGLVSLFGALVTAAKLAYGGVNAYEAIGAVKNIFLQYVWTLVLACFAILGGLVFFIVPGLLLVVWFVLCPFVAATGKGIGLTALLRSREYIRNYFELVAVRIGFLLLLAIIFFLALVVVLRAVIPPAWGHAFIAFASAVSGPVVILYFAALYKNMRGIKPEVEKIEFSLSQRLVLSGLIVVGFLAVLFAAWAYMSGDFYFVGAGNAMRWFGIKVGK